MAFDPSKPKPDAPGSPPDELQVTRRAVRPIEMPGVKKSEPQLSPPSSDTSLADLPYELRPVSPSQQAKVELRPDPTDANKASGGNRVRANASSPPVSRREQERERRVRENELRKRNQNLRAQNGGSLWPAYTLFTSTVLLLAAWLIGPRLVEEYNFAATRGRIRAQYENATEILKEHPLENVSRAFQLIAHKVRPSVVSVNATKTISGGRIGSQLTGFGSGVIMSPEGYIITNAHVLEDASACQVQLHDRSRYEATLVGVDTVSDLAVLKIDAKNLIPATWGDSDQASVGSIVWAIGSPYRYDQTVTSGILSGKDRPGDKSRKQNLLQTDAAVNPGNSGGPLVNADGDVIGINTSIYGESFQGISFAVPSSTAQFVYRQLIANGQVVRGYLGVHPIEVSHRLAASMTLPDLDGAILRNVVTNSPADLAGILPGDVIRSWNGKSIGRYNTLFQMAEMTQPNSKVEVVLIRNGQQLRKEVVVGELPKVDDYFDGLRSKRIPLPTPDIPQSPDRYRSAFPKPQLFPKP